MPNKYNKSVRKQTNEVIELLLNNKKQKINEFSAGVLNSSVIENINSEEDLSAHSPNNSAIGSNNIECSSSSESDENWINDIIEDYNIRDELAKWSAKHLISNVAINELLKIIKKIEPSLPNDARALKKTPRDAAVVPLRTGEYVHYGLKDCLTDFLSYSPYDSDNIDLNFNIDGLPIAKSSLSQLWPILVNVNGTKPVHTVGVFSGNSKIMDINEFITPFVEELNEVIASGLYINGKMYKVSCRSFVCDAPARSMVMGIKGHTGYHCCHKCTQSGESIQNRMIFKLQNNSIRTDESFRTRQNINHHASKTQMAIEKLPIDVVKSFPFDYMHVVCLGVVKTLMTAWIKQTKKSFSLKPAQITLFDEQLQHLKSQTPREFCRRPRGLKEFERFKATEFRQFLLYSGPFILKNILNDKLYSRDVTNSDLAKCRIPNIRPGSWAEYRIFGRRIVNVK